MKIKIISLLILVFSISINASTDPADSVKISNLPLVITTAGNQNLNAPLVLLISGDGGWYHFEQSIANNLAKKGIPTIGLNARKYFWSRRTPGETAEDMSVVLNFYSKEWHREKIVIIGYSLGAEIVPFIVNRLSESIKRKIESTVLLSPDISTDFEIHLSNMVGIGSKQNTYNTIKEIIKMRDVPTLLIFGEDEKSRVPGLLSGTSMKIRTIPGDHHYKSNLPLVMQTINENTRL